MLIPIFRGLVAPDGTLRLRETEAAKRQAWLKSLAGQAVEVLVRPERTQRTLDQNAYIHAVPVALIAQETGDDPDAVKRDLMAACFGTVPGETGPEPWLGHTSSMDREQASYFIEWVAPYALRTFGIEVPLPGDVEIVR
jgi:hypothetical protein